VCDVCVMCVCVRVYDVCVCMMCVCVCVMCVCVWVCVCGYVCSEKQVFFVLMQFI